MRKINFSAVIFIFIFLSPIKSFYGQQQALIDSLKGLAETVKHDTLRASILLQLVENIEDGKEWLPVNERAMKIGRELVKDKNEEVRKKGKKVLAAGYNNWGFYFYLEGNYITAIEKYNLGLDIAREINERFLSAAILNNIGLIYHNGGDIPNALRYYHESVKYQQGGGDLRALGYAISNIAFIYLEMGDSDNAIKYHKQALDIRLKNGIKKDIGESYNNLGVAYRKKNQNKEALKYHLKAFEIRTQTNDKKGVAQSLNNIGTMYSDEGDLKKALEYYEKALAGYNELEEKANLAATYFNLSFTWDKMQNQDKAMKFALMSMATAKEGRSLEGQKKAALHLHSLYRKSGAYEKALEMFTLYAQIKDSTLNEKNKRELVKREFQFQYEKKAAADSIINAEIQEKKDAEITVKNLQIEKEQSRRYMLIGGITVLFIFAGLIFSRFRVTQRQKEIIESQKQVVEEKNKDILDSITYAKRIQDALLKQQSEVQEGLPDHFILMRPKDIVSGDFYWSLSKQDHVYFAVADCTGHGVPGAFMSMMGMVMLGDIAGTEELVTPAYILNKLRDKIVQELRQGGGEGNKDGMDISLVRINKITHEVMWAGANNPLYIVSENRSGLYGNSDLVTENKILRDIRPDKQPVGFHHSIKPFSDNSFNLSKGDSLYLFSDGYADQFGGEKGKKFLTRNLKELFLANSHLPMTQQKQILESTLIKWIGYLEQVDDITVAGIRL